MSPEDAVEGGDQAGCMESEQGGVMDEVVQLTCTFQSQVLVTKPKPGEKCMVCNRKVPQTNAQRQAAYRGRKA